MMWKALLLGVAVLLAAILIFAATRPDSFRVARSLYIDAPPETLFPLIDDLRNWRRWSPYENKDPAMQREFSGPQAGVGAAYAWQGNQEVGAGRMEIIESTPPSHIVIQLDFLKPFQARNQAEFLIMPAHGSTEVSWALSGPSPYLSKLLGLFIDMDRMIGGDFETGLASLKSLAESHRQPAPSR